MEGLLHLTLKLLDPLANELPLPIERHFEVGQNLLGRVELSLGQAHGFHVRRIEQA